MENKRKKKQKAASDPAGSLTRRAKPECASEVLGAEQHASRWERSFLTNSAERKSTIYSSPRPETSHALKADRRQKIKQEEKKKADEKNREILSSENSTLVFTDLLWNPAHLSWFLFISALSFLASSPRSYKISANSQPVWHWGWFPGWNHGFDQFLFQVRHFRELEPLKL